MLGPKPSVRPARRSRNARPPKRRLSHGPARRKASPLKRNLLHLLLETTAFLFAFVLGQPSLNFPHRYRPPRSDPPPDYREAANGHDETKQKGRLGFPGRPSKSSFGRVYVSALGVRLRMELEAIKCATFAAIAAIPILILAQIQDRVLALQPQRAASGLGNASAAPPHVFQSACWKHRKGRERLMGR